MMTKLPTFGALTLVACVAIAPSCSPPRPHENTSLPSSLGSGGNSSSPSGGDGDRPGTSLGGSAGAESNPQPASCAAVPSSAGTFTKESLLRSSAQCAMLRYCEFQETADELAQQANVYAVSPSEDNLDSLRSAYLQAMKSFARADLFQFGPAASASADPVGGEGLRDLIYAWTFVSRCRVEEQLFGGAYRDAGFDNLVKVPINSRGLFAIEYLSFYEENDNACTQFSITNAGEAWSNTEPSQLDQLKRDYLDAVAKDVALRAEQLTSAWAPEEGDYLDRLTNATGYMDQQQALNLVAHSLLYLEVQVKDYKVGIPAGLYEAGTIPSEATYSHGATVLLRQNLEGFSDLFAGCHEQAFGFDDWLIAAGHEDLAQDMKTALEDAQAHAARFPEMSDASIEELAQLHETIKTLTDLLKGDFFGQGSPLGLGLPSSVEGDTD